MLEDDYSEQSFEVDLFVTRGTDGTILSEATIVDPSSADAIEVWTDGTTVWWDGELDGERVHGSMAAGEILDAGGQQAAICLTPIGAIVCVGAAVVMLGGCAFGFSCEPPESNPPDSSGHGEGGGADAEGESESGEESDE